MQGTRWAVAIFVLCLGWTSVRGQQVLSVSAGGLTRSYTTSDLLGRPDVRTVSTRRADLRNLDWRGRRFNPRRPLAISGCIYRRGSLSRRSLATTRGIILAVRRRHWTWGPRPLLRPLPRVSQAGWRRRS